nr:CFI-box-CTERM domain-containing protein [Pseudorhodoferax sp. Leaf267]
MEFCEQRVLLVHRFGDRTTGGQRQARERGLAAHADYYAQGRAASDSRCFVSSCVFGPRAHETEVLRAFRDAVLMPHGWGRAVVASYYAWAPGVCAVLQNRPQCTACVRGVLRPMVALCRLHLQRRRP